MKSISIIFICLIFFAEIFTQQQTRRRLVTYYEQKKSTFEMLPNDKNEIIFLGNSLTEGCEWNELFKDSRIKNRGISGDVAEGVLLRLQEVTESEPIKIFIMIGINDLAFGYSINEILDYYKKIISKIQKDSPKTKIYIQSVLPVNKTFGKFTEYHNLSDDIIKLNTKLNILANDSGTEYINLHDAFLVNHEMNPTFTNDGLHLTGDGYMLWKNLIEKYISD
jgi:lysophospholipase L1-like esterase